MVRPIERHDYVLSLLLKAYLLNGQMVNRRLLTQMAVLCGISDGKSGT